MPEVQPTNNPVPSDHPADARDNFKRIDEFVNLQSLQTSPTRTGKTIDTLFNITTRANDQIDRIGFEVPVAYTAGLVMSRTSQTVIFMNDVYHAINVPFTTSGTFETNNFELLRAVTFSDLAVAQEQIIGGEVSIFPELISFNISNGSVIPSGTTHVRVSGDLFAIDPLAFGAVSLLTSAGCTIGTTPVLFSGALGSALVTSTGSTAPRALADRFADVVNVKDFGAVGDGVADDTAAIQAAIDFGGQDSNIVFPQGFVFNISVVNVTSRYVKLTGHGVIDGTIRIYSGNYPTANDLDMFFTVDGLNFRTADSAINAIELCYARRGNITNCEFDGHNTAIRKIQTSELPTPQTWGQNVNRIRVVNNTYTNVGYFIRSEVSAGITFDVADWIVSSNEGQARFYHVHVLNIDGLTLNDNIMFFAGSTLMDQDKMDNVFIQNGVWLNIHDNKFFEAGRSGLTLSSCSRYNVHDNLYAFPGQRVESPAVNITNTPISGQYFSQGTVHNENIEDPSGVGISISENQGRLQVAHNLIQRPGSSVRYYGTTPLSGDTIGIDMSSSQVLDVNVNDNHVRWGVNNYVQGVSNSCRITSNIVDEVGDGSSTYRETLPRILVLTEATATSIDITYYDAVHFAFPGAENIVSIVNSGVSRSVLFRNFNTNTVTFTHSATLHLSGSVDAVLGNRDTLTMQVDGGGNAVEIARSI